LVNNLSIDFSFLPQHPMLFLPSNRP